MSASAPAEESSIGDTSGSKDLTLDRVAEQIVAAAIAHRRARGLGIEHRVLVPWPGSNIDRMTLQARLAYRDAGITLCAI